MDGAPYDGARAGGRRLAWSRLVGEVPPAPAPRGSEPEARFGVPLPADDLAPDLSKLVPIKDQRPTYYITVEERGFPTAGPLYGQNYDGTERKTVRTPSGRVLAETSGRYFAALCMEGSGYLLDGRCVGFVSNQRFMVLPQGCSGMGSTGYWELPFHTLAVSPREMPYKGVYFIPALRGLTMPDGQVHDGYWFAHDTGSAFQGTPKHRIDMYVLKNESIGWMEQHVVPSLTPTPVYRVDAATRDNVYAKYGPLLGP